MSARGSKTLNLEIVNRSGAAVPQAFLRKWVSLMAREAAKPVGGSGSGSKRNDGGKPAVDPKLYSGRDFVIAFVSKDEIRKLNKQYRGKNKATDVLSFESDDPSSIGELAIAPEVISLQAREHGLLVREELGYMVLHGFLHLLGYDHETNEQDAARMFALQDELFERLLRKV